MKKIILAAMLSCCLVFTSCEVLNTLTNQLQGIANLANCSYSLKNVTGLSVAGVNVKNISNGNISATDLISIGSALVSKKVPLTMNVNVDVTNPTTSPALLSTMDWVLEIEGKQVAAGTTNSNTTIAAGRTTSVPLSVGTDVYDIFKNGGKDAIVSFIKSFSSDGTSSKVAIKIKPYVTVGGVSVPSPNYITLEKETGNNNANTGSTNTNTGSTNPRINVRGK